MAQVSNKAYFLDAIRSNPMTIIQIVETFNIAINTARQWVKGDDVEHVPGTWPPAYVRKDTLTLDSIHKAPDRKAPAPSNTNKVTVEFDRPPQEEVEAFFRRIMAGEAGNIDFQNEFRSVDSQKSLLLLKNKIKSAYIVIEYYQALMKHEGID